MRVGTRGSALALAQSAPVAEALGGELVVITTTGDRDPSRAAGDKARWTSALERALLAGEIDVAVHSAKDVPIDLADGTALLPSPPRADARDALCGAAALADLPAGAQVGTASVRREAQLRAVRPDLDVVELRGNVDTRLERLAAGHFDAIVLAMAGLERLGRADEGVALDELVPSAGQGVLALQARAGEDFEYPADEDATRALACERALIRALVADCDTPVGAHAVSRGREGLRLEAFVGRADGSAWLRDEQSAGGHPDPEALGAELGERLLSAGAAAILGR